MLRKKEILQSSQSTITQKDKFRPLIIQVEKENKQNNKIILNREEAYQMIERIRNEVKYHLNRSHHFKTKMKNILELLKEELITIKELNRLVVSLQRSLNLKKSSEKKINKSNQKKEKNLSKNENQKKEQILDLDRELEMIKIISQLLETKNNSNTKEEAQQIKLHFLTKKNNYKSNISQSNHSPKILIIEDDPIVIKLIGYFLIKENYSVSFGFNGEEGLVKAIKEKPDLILLDIMMPVMDGFQLLEILKNDKELANIPIIILSSLSQDADILRALKKGASDYLTKPLSPQILLAKIKKYLPSEQ